MKHLFHSTHSAKLIFGKIMLIFLLPFCLFLFLINVYSHQNYIQRLTENHQTRISMYTSFLNEDIQNIEHFMADMVANDGNYLALMYPLNDVDSYLQIYALHEKFSTVMDSINIATGFLLDCPKVGMSSDCFRADVPYEQQENLILYFQNIVEKQQDQLTPEWQLADVNDQYYFYKIIGGSGIYTVCIISVQNISSDEQTENTKSFLLFEKDGIPLAYTQEMEEQNIQFDNSNYNIQGGSQDYLVVRGKETFLGCNVISMETYRSIGSDVFYPVLIIFSTITLFCLMIYSALLIKQKFLYPLMQMVETMEQIKDGETEKTLSICTPVREYQKIESTFNQMMNRIRDLRILAYDRLLKIQQTELQFYQLQIRPHFYLNCLKNLYAMAATGKQDVVCDMILVLSQYLRNVLSDHSELVPLSKELEGVNSYIQLQQMSNAIPCTYLEDISPNLYHILVPPMSILTFVENCFKHQDSQCSSLRILVKARIFHDEVQDFVNLTIMDNGPGFSPDVLKALNQKDNKLPGHLGIYNVQQRLSLLYQNQYNILFRNADGACVDIFFPYEATTDIQTDKHEKGGYYDPIDS